MRRLASALIACMASTAAAETPVEGDDTMKGDA